MDGSEELHDENGVNLLSFLVLRFRKLRQRKCRRPFRQQNRGRNRDYAYQRTESLQSSSSFRVPRQHSSKAQNRIVRAATPGPGETRNRLVRHEKRTAQQTKVTQADQRTYGQWPMPTPPSEKKPLARQNATFLSAWACTLLGSDELQSETLAKTIGG